MDYKQKYEQALEYMRTGYPTLTGATKEDVEHHFPELKENKDEEIRKHLLKHFCNKTNEEWNGMPIKNIVAWLEKQGGKIDIANKEYWRGYREGKQEIIDKYSNCNKVDMTEYNNGYECGKQRVLKYPEDYGLCKKPVWSEEDERMLQKTLSIIRYELSIPIDKEDDPCFVGSSTISWLKSLKERFNLQQKHEWTINNAKPGDILHTSSTASSKIFIFKGIRNDEHGSVECFCCYDSEDGFRKGEEELIGWKTDRYRLATPKQCIELGRIIGKYGYIFRFETNQLQKLD